jgi:hypothetical protein
VIRLLKKIKILLDSISVVDGPGINTVVNVYPSKLKSSFMLHFSQVLIEISSINYPYSYLKWLLKFSDLNKY